MFTWPRAATTTTTTTTELAVGSCAGLVSFDCDEGNSELRGARPRGSRPFVLHSVIASFLLDAFVNAPVCRCGVKNRRLGRKTWKKDLEARLGRKTCKKDLQERLGRNICKTDLEERLARMTWKKDLQERLGRATCKKDLHTKFEHLNTWWRDAH